MKQNGTRNKEKKEIAGDLDPNKIFDAKQRKAIEPVQRKAVGSVQRKAVGLAYNK
jgi:hypothetical protein